DQDALARLLAGGIDRFDETARDPGGALVPPREVLSRADGHEPVGERHLDASRARSPAFFSAGLLARQLLALRRDASERLREPDHAFQQPGRARRELHDATPEACHAAIRVEQAAQQVEALLDRAEQIRLGDELL